MEASILFIVVVLGGWLAVRFIDYSLRERNIYKVPDEERAQWVREYTEWEESNRTEDDKALEEWRKNKEAYKEKLRKRQRGS